MKKIIFLSTVLIISVNVLAQKPNDGFARPVKGAYWNDGLRGQISKYIVEKKLVAGYHKIVLNGKTHEIEVFPQYGDEMVLFAEYSNRNRNWVVLNPGEIVWRFWGQTQEYLANCGNKISKREPKTTIKKEFVDRVVYDTLKIEVEKLVYRDRIQSKSSDIEIETDCDTARKTVDRILSDYKKTIFNRKGSKKINFKDAKRLIADLRFKYPDCNLEGKVKRKIWGWFAGAGFVVGGTVYYLLTQGGNAPAQGGVPLIPGDHPNLKLTN